MATDPICGMTVEESTPYRYEQGGDTYYFCSEHCLKKFATSAQATETDQHKEHSCCQHESEPVPNRNSTAAYFCPMCEGVESDQPGDCPKCGMALESARPAKNSDRTIYTCPMHPEVEQDHPGSCPKCGMDLEPKTIAAEEDDTELRNMTFRFWVAFAFSLPVFLLAMLPMVGVPISRWLGHSLYNWSQLVLSTPVVLWAGWPFFVRGWKSVVTWNLNMFTLIAIGTGAAFLYSVVAILFPTFIPDDFKHQGIAEVYFEAAAVIITLVLLGQVLELRARRRTSGAIRELMSLAPPIAQQKWLTADKLNLYYGHSSLPKISLGIDSCPLKSTRTRLVS